MPADIPVDILAVDDNAANLKSLEALLRDVNANLVQASSGEDALRQLLAREFALILLDVQMPNLDGYETAKLIRARDRTRHVPIIFLTALNRNEVNIIRGYSLGAVDFLFKPIVPEILRSKVNVFLDLHRKTIQTQQQAALLREADKREAQRQVAQARAEVERTLLQQQMERERRVAQELAQLVEEKARAEVRLALLAESADQLLLSQVRHQEVFERVTQHLGLDAHLALRVEPGERLALTSHSGVSLAALERLEPIPFGTGVCGVAANSRTRVVLEGLSEARAPADELVARLGLDAVACFPLVAHEHLLGTVLFGERRPRRFTHDELALLQGVCDQVAASMERDRLIDELRDRDRRKDEFLAMLAHELRNPMAPIRSAIDVLRAGAGDEPKVRRALDSADRQVTHMTRLVDDLLDVSRITRGKVELRRDRVALATVVEQAVLATDPLIRERRHQLSVALPPEPLHLIADGTRLTQVFANLLHNAAKYTDPGGQIRVTAATERGEVVVRVADTGIGMKPEMLAKVFDIFVQVEPTSDRASGGLGLGLTLVRSLVAMHEGTVTAHSEGLGRGSVFEVRLPLAVGDHAAAARAEPAVAAAALNGEPAPGSANGKLPPLEILLVEDNPDIRTTMRDLLEMHGHHVREADDGESGVAMALSQLPNVALVDIGLPGLDGYAVAERIRAAAEALPVGERRPRLVALTGYGNAEATRRAMEAGFDAHLVKPVSFTDLSQVLRKLC